MTTLKASPRVAAPLFLATVGLSLLALHCSSDSTDGSTLGGGATATTGGSAGVATQAGSAGVAGMTTGGVTTGGSVGTAGTVGTGGTTTTAGTATGGSTTAGAGGSSGGVGGTGGATGGGGAGGTGGTGGATAGSSGSGGAGGSGGASPTFTAVKELMAKSCGVGTCHNAASMELNFQDVANLYKTLTSAVPAGNKHCAGNPAVIKANDTNSLLLKAIAAKGAACMNNGANQTIGQMPDGCPKANEPCLTTDQIKVFTDWVAAGAPM